MKKFKQFILPAVIVLLGAGAAFATNAAKDSNVNLELGYYIDSSDQCVKTQKNCSPTGSIACTWESHNLYRLNETSCVKVLFEPER